MDLKDKNWSVVCGNMELKVWALNETTTYLQLKRGGMFQSMTTVDLPKEAVADMLRDMANAIETWDKE